MVRITKNRPPKLQQKRAMQRVQIKQPENGKRIYIVASWAMALKTTAVFFSTLFYVIGELISYDSLPFDVKFTVTKH